MSKPFFYYLSVAAVKPRDSPRAAGKAIRALKELFFGISGRRVSFWIAREN
jgi:hypothetical protein